MKRACLQGSEVYTAALQFTPSFPGMRSLSQCLLASIPFRFHVLASEDARLFHMANLRSILGEMHRFDSLRVKACSFPSCPTEVVRSFKLVGRSAIQRIFEPEGFRLLKLRSHGAGGCDPAMLAQQFMQELPTTSGKEDVTSEAYVPFP